MRRLVVHCCLAVAFVALAAPFGPAWAQIETGRIAGTVTDAQGGVVPGVTVIAKSPNTGITAEDVDKAQQDWCDGLIEISRRYRENLDYQQYANDFIDRLYDFREGRVFFRPTLAMAP